MTLRHLCHLPRPPETRYPTFDYLHPGFTQVHYGSRAAGPSLHTAVAVSCYLTCSLGVIMITLSLRDCLLDEGYRFALLPPQFDSDVPAMPALVRDLVLDGKNISPTADQERLFWVDAAAGGDSCLNINLGFEVAGPIDGAALDAACRRLLLQEQVLRQRFVQVDGRPVIRSVVELPKSHVRLTDLSDTPAERRGVAIEAHARRTAARPFDLSAGPLFRIDLFRMAPDRHVLYVTSHHIASDLRSLFAIATKLLAHHEDVVNGCALALGEPEETPVVRAPAAPESLAFWRDALRTMPTAPLFPAGDGPRRPRRAGQLRIAFPEAEWRQVTAAGKRHGMAGMVIMLAAFRLWLAELAGKDDFTLTVPLHRDRSSGLKIGFSGAPTVFDGSIDRGWSIRDLIVDTRVKLRRASPHRDVSLAELDALGRSAGIAFPKPTAMFSYSPFPFDPACGSLTIERLWPICRPSTDLDIALWVGEWGRATDREFILEYDRSRFDRFDALAAAERYFAIIAALADVADAPVADLLRADRAARPMVLRIVASFTAEPIADVIEHWAGRLDMPLEIAFAGYSQVLQELLSPDSGLRRNREGLNIVLLRPEDWLRARPDRDRLLGDPAALAQVIEAAADEHVAALRAVTDVSVLVAFAPACDAQTARIGAAAEARMAQALHGCPNVRVLPWAEAAARLKVRDPLDPVSDALGHVPLSREGFAALGSAVMRAVHEQWRPPFKVIVVDCDNTLWAGAVGDLGTDGIVIGAQHRRLQARLAAAAEAGLMVCLCSKNRECDVLDVFETRADMVLRRAHLVAWRINWDLKSANIHDLALTLGLGLDSFVVIDDNPLEIAEISAALPAVTAILAPLDDEDFADHLWPLDRSRATREDRARSELYRVEAERTEHRRAAATYAEFIASLDLAVEIGPPQAGDIERVAQLTTRTNQFNIDPRGWRAEQIRPEDDADGDGRLWRAVHAADRFGSYGLVGVVGARREGAALCADTFLMSCRVLGRGVEHRMVNELGRLALERGLQAVELAFRATDRNGPVQRFLTTLPATVRPTSTHHVFRMDAASAAQMAFAAGPAEDEPGAEPPKAAPPTPKKAARLAPVPGAVFAAIAADFATAGAIARVVWPEPGPLPAPAADEPAQDGDLAATARQAVGAVLGRERFDETIPFWRHGLSSLATMRLVADLRRKTGTAVEFRDIHDCASFTDLVRRLGARRSGATPDVTPQGGPSQAERDQTLLRGILRRKAARPPQAGDAIFVTGATGFLGAHLVAELVRRTHRPIICLIRADDASGGCERLRAALLRSGHAEAARGVGRQLSAVAGDLDRPRLGLGEAAFAHLIESVGLVLHNGATVSFAAPYAALREANVLGTLETIRLAAAAGAPLHFVSTLAVFDALSWLDGETAGEQELPESVTDVLHGYAQTKYVSERHIAMARARGLPCSVYRPGNIVGDSRDGTWVPGDAVSRLLRGSLDTGIMPDRPGALDLTPVDHVARAIAALALHEPEANCNFHIVNPRRHAICDITAWCRANGHPLVTTSLSEWMRRLEVLCQSEPEHPAAPILGVLQHGAGGDDLPLIDLIERRPIPECAETVRRLQRLGVACPDLDAETFGRSLHFLKAAGYLRDDPDPALLRSAG
ncbi:thioester reductase domain-containing protein [Xanthobacter sediminis]